MDLIIEGCIRPCLVECLCAQMQVYATLDTHAAVAGSLPSSPMQHGNIGMDQGPVKRFLSRLLQLKACNFYTETLEALYCTLQIHMTDSPEVL